MSRAEVYQEIESTFGLVPKFLRALPDSSLQLEWQLMKKLQVDEGLIPAKYRELIGLGIAATTRCRYCTFFHTEMARLNGATDEELEEALHFAKETAGWSAYINGLQLDYSQFQSEIRQACDHVRSTAATLPPGKVRAEASLKHPT